MTNAPRRRRAFVALAIGFVLLAAACTGTPTPTPTTPVARGPNLILIVTDDQWVGTLGVQPNVQRLLVQQGVTFSNDFVTTSLCCPSRASMLTGQYAHHHGVLDRALPNGGALAFHDTSTLATWLHDAGYRTALIGKYLNQTQKLPAGYVPPGWDDWHALAGGEGFFDYTLSENGTVHHYGTAPADYFTDVITDRAVSFVKASTGQPFFLYFAPTAPHLPADPAPQDAGAFANTSPARPPSFNEADVSDKPWASRQPLLTKAQIATWDGLRRKALGSLLAVDRAVARLVTTLQSEGVLDDTVIAYTSDNGFLWGEHRLLEKLWPYDPSIRVPLIIRGPGFAPGTTNTNLTENIDLPVTFAELGGAKPGLPVDGRSLLTLLRGEHPDPAWRTEVLIEYLGHIHGPFLPADFSAVRTARYLYVEYADGGRELYDLKVDPDELTNLAADPAMASVRADLATRLRTLKA